jgi:hypothetical protein
LRTIRLIGIYQLSAIYLKNAFDFSGKASRAKQAPQRAPLPKVGSPFSTIEISQRREKSAGFLAILTIPESACSALLHMFLLQLNKMQIRAYV